MTPQAPARVRRWQATLIIGLFAVAVAAAAAIGWWYARESPAHQGPIVLITVDGMSAADLPAYGNERRDLPAIDGLATDAVVFERAYTHATDTLPAHASILSGQLPPDHGVRADVGFPLDASARTLAEMLRSRGFATGGAVSSFLLRPETGLAQGFTFFDAELPPASDFTPAIARPGAGTMDAAERWLAQQDDQRFFFFLQVAEDDADSAVTRVSNVLKERRLYDDATIVLVGDRGTPVAGSPIDDATVRVPLLVKQPDAAGAGRRIDTPVQHVDLVPTILDLVRAPVSGELRGRSLRQLLDGDSQTLQAADIYSESMRQRFQFGGDPVLSLTDGIFRYVQGPAEELVRVAPGDGPAGGEAAENGRLRTALNLVLSADVVQPGVPMSARDEDRYALLGFLPVPRLRLKPSGLDAIAQLRIAQAHHAAAVLIGQKKYSAGIRALQAIVRDHPDLGIVHYQLGTVLVRTGRLDEAIAAFESARDQSADAPDVTLALADALARAGRVNEAWDEAMAAVALAGTLDPRQRAAAHEMAARVALARRDAETASAHATAADEAHPAGSVATFVRGRLAYEAGDYEGAAAAFQDAVAATRDSGDTLSELHFYFGEALAHLARYREAEAEYREELAAFPRNIQAYTSLAMLYRASNRDADVEDVLNELVASTPTPEGYGVAAQLWTMLGDRSRAEALRSDARARFKGDPSLALLGQRPERRPDGRPDGQGGRR